jgi:hypothetical protein
MMADVALAYPSGITLSDRLSSMHAAELQGFINAATTRWGRLGRRREQWQRLRRDGGRVHAGLGRDCAVSC